MSSAGVAALRASLLPLSFSDEELVEREPLDVDGCRVSATLIPRDGESLAQMLGALSERELAVVVRGGGTRLGLGNPPHRADAILSTERLVGVDTFDAQDGVAYVRAGTRLSGLRAEVNAQGWELPLDPPGESSTVGGCLATAATGPRRLGFGAPRDCVLGLDVALASGERTRCGGRVVKNVTGYDLAKLYTGSFGTLGVIEAAWLRLRPLPERVELRVASFPDRAETFESALAISRRASSRAVALMNAPAAGALDHAVRSSSARAADWLLLAELAGDAPAVVRDARWLEEEFAAERPDPGLGPEPIAELRALQGRAVAPRGARTRIAALPSRLAPVCGALSDAGLIVYPALGLVYAVWSGDTSPVSDADLDRVAHAAREAEGTVVCEELSPELKQKHDVFGDPGSSLSLMRALKTQFDPRGTLNPGRFQGRL